MLNNNFSFAFDLEDRRPSAFYEKRYCFVTDKLVSLLEKYQAAGVFLSLIRWRNKGLF